MNIDKYRMQEIPFRGDPWEFICSLVFLKYNKKINIVEFGEGNYSLVYGICTELEHKIKKIFSIDDKNKFDKGETDFYNKKRIYMTLDNRGYEYVEHIQCSCNDEIVSKLIKKLFLDDAIDLLIIEYMKNDEYMDEIFNLLNIYLKEDVDIYVHNIYKSKDSYNYFINFFKDKKHVTLNNGYGTCIIKKDK
ncbi:MAG: hypothetical protein ACOCUI_00620 [bacterium]